MMADALICFHGDLDYFLADSGQGRAVAVPLDEVLDELKNPKTLAETAATTVQGKAGDTSHSSAASAAAGVMRNQAIERDQRRHFRQRYVQLLADIDRQKRPDHARAHHAEKQADHDQPKLPRVPPPAFKVAR